MKTKPHIFLIGMMGSGKSTVGQALAKHLNYSFYDMDELITIQYNMSISEIFHQFGETGFRLRETEVSRSIPLDISPAVIATGGGFPLDDGNFLWMKEHGRIIWIQAAACTIMERIGTSQDRPLFSKESLIPMMNERTFVYEKADYYISNDGQDISKIVNEIIKQVIDAAD